MLKPFTLSKAVAYNGAGLSTTAFDTKPKGLCMISAITYQTADPLHAHKNLVSGIKVAGRVYMQGDGAPLALLAPSPAIPAAGNGFRVQPYFPGSLHTLRSGQQIGGILIKNRENFEIAMQDLTVNAAPILALTVHGFQFPDDGPLGAAARPRWERLMAGIGETVFFGNVKAAYVAQFTENIEQTPAPVHGKLLRRLAVRGALYDAAFALQEADFENLSAELSTQSQRHPGRESVPARHIIGHAGLDWPEAEVDMHHMEKTLVRIVAPTPGAARTLRLLSIFEGRDAQETFKGTADGL